MRGEFIAIAAGFALLPTLSGNGNKAVVVNAGGTALTVTTGALALAGDLATTGAFNTTLAQTATVTLTLPAVSGTLATLAGTETLSNKTLVAPALGTPASGVLTNCTGTASGLTAGSVTTNANLTGPITSSGNATAIAAQTGIGTTFVMQASPTLTGTVVLPAGTTYVGDSTAPAGVTNLGAVIGTDTLSGTVFMVRKAGAGTNAPSMSFLKSRGTQASPVIITTGDGLGAIAGTGFDGASFVTAANITFGSTGTIGTGIVPGTITFKTANASGVLTTAGFIDQLQSLNWSGPAGFSGTTTFNGTAVVFDTGTKTATASSGAATLHKTSGKITSEALTTAAGADYVLTLTNSRIVDSGCQLYVSVDNGSNTTEGIAVNRVTPGSGSAVIRIRNTNAASALNGTIVISFMVLAA